MADFFVLYDPVLYGWIFFHILFLPNEPQVFAADHRPPIEQIENDKLSGFQCVLNKFAGKFAVCQGRQSFIAFFFINNQRLRTFRKLSPVNIITVGAPANVPPPLKKFISELPCPPWGIIQLLLSGNRQS